MLDTLEKICANYEVTSTVSRVILKLNNCIYECSLDDGDILHPAVGTIANSFYKACGLEKNGKYNLENQYGYKKIYNKTDPDEYSVEWDYKIACGYQTCNESYSLKNLICWSYDVNSSYSFAMLKPMPDTTKEPRYNDTLKANEIGFFKSGAVTTKENSFAEIIFPLMDSPFKKYIYKHYEKKKDATGTDRQIEKNYLNIVTGLVARRNIFFRNTLIHYSNEYVKKYIDENTVYCNIDCIVSLVPRPEIPIGKEIGQFKLERNGEQFKFKSNGIYQWGKETHYLGIPANSLDDIEILNIKLPYYFNKEKKRIEKWEEKNNQ